MQQIKLGLSMRGLGYHPSAWRDPDVPPDGSMDVKYAIRVAQMAERGLFDFVFLADHAAIVEHDLPKGVFGRHHSDIAEFEPLTLLAALSQVTTKIGLIATASTTLHQPYQLARQFLSIDHLSGGRAGWNVVTSSRDAEAQNFGQDKILEKRLRYERAKEALDVVFGLWESWEEDAFPRDRKTGVFFDPAKMHRIDHVGEYFRVRGPLTVPRSPQGRPVIAQAGASSDGADFAASVADIVYALQTRFEDAQVNYKASKERIAKLGRNPDHVKILPGLLPIVARTTEEAQAKYKRLLSYLDPLVGLERLTRWFGDLSGHDLDGPLPDLRPDVRPVSRADLNLRLAREHNWTIRQLYESTVISHGHHVAIGSPVDIADDMERWIKEEAADGFNIVPAVLPSGVDDFVEYVIPELQRRKLFRTEYEGSTLRENLGLPFIAPRFPRAVPREAAK
jgi:FMN-dependent oxidoreductase (nitrilotriacetate monooxygenase family)